jgi:hypothetical protein
MVHCKIGLILPHMFTFLCSNVTLTGLESRVYGTGSCTPVSGGSFSMLSQPIATYIALEFHFQAHPSEREYNCCDRIVRDRVTHFIIKSVVQAPIEFEIIKRAG